MPIPTNIETIIEQRLRTCPFVFVKTCSDDVQDVVEAVVHDYVARTGAVLSTRLSDGPYIAHESCQHTDRTYVVFIRDWDRYSGNDVMAAFNQVFEEDLQRHGPNSWCDEKYRHRRFVMVGDRRVDVPIGSLYQNLKLVFCGGPINDPGLSDRLRSYTIK